MAVIDWLHEASISAVARQFDLSWDQVAGIQDRAVLRGLARRKLSTFRVIGVDETSFKRHHEYVTIVNDLAGKVLHVADDRGQEALTSFYHALGAAKVAKIEQVTMDMWPAYIRCSIRAHATSCENFVSRVNSVGGKLQMHMATYRLNDRTGSKLFAALWLELVVGNSFAFI